MARIQSLILLSALTGALSVGLMGCGDDEGGTTDAGDAGGEGGQGGRSGSGGRSGQGGESGNESDGGDAGGTSGGAGGMGGSGGSMVVPPVVCGGDECPAVAAQAAMLGVTNCCQDNDECGTSNPLVPGECLPANAPGSLDLSCPEFDAMFQIWPGCCTPDGQCGALSAGMGGLGCVANETLMAPESSCTFDPNNTCTSITEVACDGNEDCGSGELCCGTFAGGGYTSATCQATAECALLATADAALGANMYFEFCHPDDVCATEGFTCARNALYLPPFLARCRDDGDPPDVTAAPNGSGVVNCGESPCGAGQKCCLPTPGDPLCVDADEECRCTAETGDGGVDDAGL